MDDYQSKRAHSGAHQPLPENPRNTTDLATSQLTVTSTPQQINLVNPKRSGTKITNLSATPIFYGPTSAVTTSTGDIIPIGGWIFVPAQSVLWVVVATGLTGLISWADCSGHLPAIAAGSIVGLNKITTIETKAPLGANAVFTGPWHDSQIDGMEFVVVCSFSDQAGAASGLSIDQSNDNGNANFTISSVNSIQPGANTLAIVSSALRLRFWRVRYTNGAVQQANLEITSCATNFTPSINGSNNGSITGNNGPLVPVINAQGSISIGAGSGTDNITAWTPFSGEVPIANNYYGGAFSGTADVNRQGLSKGRTPTVFKQSAATAAGSTAIWTPGAGNKFRLLAWRIIISQTTTLAAAGDEVIKLLDAAADIAQDVTVRIGAAAGTSGVIYDSGWQQLGFFGILSTAANNALNVNLGTAVAAGSVQVLVAGVEE